MVDPYFILCCTVTCPRSAGTVGFWGAQRNQYLVVPPDLLGRSHCILGSIVITPQKTWWMLDLWEVMTRCMSMLPHNQHDRFTMIYFGSQHWWLLEGPTILWGTRWMLDSACCSKTSGRRRRGIQSAGPSRTWTIKPWTLAHVGSLDNKHCWIAMNKHMWGIVISCNL